jgi:hypothetical protein
MYHRPLDPCTQAVKFSGRDHTSLCHVYPGLKALKRHFREQVAAAKSQCPELLQGWHSLTKFLQLRQQKLLDRELVQLTFWLTLFGCTWLAARHELIPRSHQLQLTYQSLPKALIVEPLDMMSGAKESDGEIAEENEDQMAECIYTGDTIGHESLKGVLTIPVPKGKTLTFVTEMLVKFLLEEIPESDPIAGEISDEEEIERSIRTRIESLVSLFFCSDDHGYKCRDTSARIHDQITLWNFLDRNSPDQQHADIFQKIISTISIPSSEASCERSFSRQKRIMRDSRARHKADSLRARFLLKESEEMNTHSLFSRAYRL